MGFNIIVEKKYIDYYSHKVDEFHVLLMICSSYAINSLQKQELHLIASE